MTAPALARGKTGRRYVWPPNTDTPELVVPSVTTILGNLNKPALVNWAAKEVASYAVDNLPAWEALPPDDAIDLLKRAPYRNMSKKGDIGTAVHAAIEATASEETAPVIDPDLLPYVAGAIQFFEDMVDEVVHLEVTIFNRAWQYAGTTDAILKLKDGRLVIADWKTSNRIYPETALQLQAYAAGEFIGWPDGRSEPLPDVEVGLVVHLPGDATYTAKEVVFSERLFKTFGALRTLQAWKDSFEADVFVAEHKGGAA